MPDELVFPASRAKALLLFVASLLFVAAALWMPSDDEPLIRWACLIFFGLGSFALLIVIMVPGAMQLRLNRDGFEAKSITGSKKTRWQDVKSFRARGFLPFLPRRLSARFINVQYQPGYEANRAARAATSALFKVEGVISNIYAISLTELEQTLNAWLERFGAPAP